MNIQNVNPNIVYASLIIIALLLGIGEFVFGKVPIGTTLIFLGGILGHGITVVSAKASTQGNTTNDNIKQG